MLEELTGKKLLLVGHGAIGQEMERMFAPFHVEITRVARTARTEPRVHPVSEIDALIPDAEIIVLILPLTAETHHLIGAKQFALMRQGTLLVNAARGPIVDTDALVDALNQGENSRRTRRYGPRAIARRASALEVPEPAHHTARRRFQPTICAARHSNRGRRAAPLHRR